MAHQSKSWRNLAAGVLLITISIGVSFVIGEIVLRTFFPTKYFDAFTATNVVDSTKIWAPPANTTNMFRHPDTGKPIPLVRNNLGIRAKRDILANDLERSVNLAFFGDSATANIRLIAPHTFSEVLNHLLNGSSEKFEVLNFGVDGYGPAQSYVRYRELDGDIRKQLKRVVYLLYENDLQDLLEHKLASLDETGRIVIVPKFPHIPEFLRGVTRLHMTYLIVDAANRIAGIRAAFENSEGETPEARQQSNQYYKSSLALLNAVLIQWQGDVEAAGGKFYVAVYPKRSLNSLREGLDSRLTAVDMHAFFSDVLPDYRHAMIQFKNDGHWNETGNLVASLMFYDLFGADFGLPQFGEQELLARLGAYYRSIPDGWTPGRVGKLRFDDASGRSN